MSQAGEPPASPPGGRGQGRASRLRSVNLAVRLLCELALLVALAVQGFHVGSGLAGDLVLGLGAPLLAAVVWGLWVAPASRRRLADPARLLVEVLLFAAGVAALAVAGFPLVAVGFAAVVAVNITLDRVLAQEAAMAFVLGVLLFVVVAGILDSRLIPWPRPENRGLRR